MDLSKSQSENAAIAPDAKDAKISLAQRLVLLLIRGYQITLSPWIGRQCRFYPTCSHYASEAIVTHGVLRGTWLTITRLGKCHPFHPGGVDLVPNGTKGASHPQPTSQI